MEVPPRAGGGCKEGTPRKGFVGEENPNINIFCVDIIKIILGLDFSLGK